MDLLPATESPSKHAHNSSCFNSKVHQLGGALFVALEADYPLQTSSVFELSPGLTGAAKDHLSFKQHLVHRMIKETCISSPKSESLFVPYFVV